MRIVCVQQVESDGVCVGKVKVGDTLIFIETGTDVAQLQTRYAPDNIKHRVTTTFLKAVVGHIKILVHRMADEAQREGAPLERAASPERASPHHPLLLSLILHVILCLFGVPRVDSAECGVA